VVRSSRPNLAAGCIADWLPGLGVDRPLLPGCGLGHRRSRALHRQRTQNALHHAAQRSGALRHGLRERNGQSANAVFTNVRSQPLSRDGVQYILAQHVEKARAKCPSLKTKRVSPHVLHHSTAMDLVQNGVDRSVIAMWLGHESMDTTQMYLHANIELKEKALAKTEPFRGQHRRYRPPDQLLAFLQAP